MRKLSTIVAIVILILLALLPWGLQSVFNPMQAPVLVKTLTAYAPTESFYETRVADDENKATSVFETLPPPETEVSSNQSQLQLASYELVQAATETSDPNVQPTATIPIPVARQPSATPMNVHVELTEEKAAELAQSDFPELRNVAVDITPQEIRVTGLVGGSGPVGQGISIAGTLRVDENKKIVMDATHVELNGRDITHDNTGERAARALNNWLRGLQSGQEVLSMQTQEGVVIYDALQYQSGTIPTAIVTPDPVTLTAVALTGTPTSEFYIIPDDATIVPTEVAAESATNVGAPNTSADAPTPPQAIQVGANVVIPNATGTQPMGVGTNPTATIPPPVAHVIRPTQTPPPTQGPAQPREIKQEQLGIINNLGPISNATIQFTPDGLVLSGELGDIAGLTSLIPGANVKRTVVVTVRLVAKDGQLVPVINALTINGEGVDEGNLVAGIEQALSGWLNGQIGNMRVDSVSTDNGLLTLNTPPK